MNIQKLVMWCALVVGMASASGVGHAVADDRLTATNLVGLPDGRRIAIHCEGEGSPAVIFDSGLGMGISVWRKVQTELSKRTRTCAYDRAGYGLSDPGPFPRDAVHIEADLEALVQAAKIPRPYVLVGHSMAGYDLRLYASLHRNNVVGMVLIDPSIDGDDTPLIAAVPNWKQRTDASNEAAMKCIRATAAGRMKPSDPLYIDCGSPPPGSLMAKPGLAQTVLSEQDNLGASSAEVTAAQIQYGAMPLIVLTAGGQFSATDGWTPAENAALMSAWREGHRHIARLSTRGTERVIDGAPHVIHTAKPEAVIDAVDEVIRDGR